MKKLFTIGLAGLVVGAAISVASFVAADFDITNLSHGGGYTVKTYSSESTPKIIRLNDKGVAISLTVSDGDSVTVTYSENNIFGYTVTETDGILEILSDRSQPGQIPVDWSFKTLDITIELPQEYAGSIDIHSENSALYIDGIDADSITADITGGSISAASVNTAGECDLKTVGAPVSVTDCGFKGDFTVRTTEAPITLKNISVLSSGSITAVTTDGAITASELTGNKVKLETTASPIDISGLRAMALDTETTDGRVDITGIDVYGKIVIKTTNAGVYGDIYGSSTDYSIITNLAIENNSMANSFVVRERKIDINAANGEIDVKFTEKD